MLKTRLSGGLRRTLSSARRPAEVATLVADAMEPRTMLSATPTLSNANDNTVAAEDGNAAKIARSLVVRDADYTGGGELSFSFANVASAPSDGRLVVRNDPTGNVTITGSDVFFGGTQVAVLNETQQSVTFELNQDANRNSVLRLGRLVSYEVLGDDPATDPISIDISFTDAAPGGPMAPNTVTETATVTVKPRNDQPILSAGFTTDTADVFTPLQLFPGATVDDLDSADFDGGYAIVYVDSPTGNPAPEFDVNGPGVNFASGNVIVDGVGVGSGFASADRFRVNFNAGATPAVVQRVAQAITLAADQPGDFDLRLRLGDGDGGAGTSEAGTVSFTNVPPDIRNVQGTTGAARAGAGPRRIASSFALDDDDYNLTGGGSLVVTPLSGEGTIGVIDGAGIVLAGNDVTFNGTLVGTAAFGGDGSLTVNFNSASTLAAVRNLGQRISYEIPVAQPAGTEDVSFTFTDVFGDGDTETMTVTQRASANPGMLITSSLSVGDEQLILDQLISGL